MTAVNGAVLPTYCLQPREVQHCRFIHAGRDEPLVLGWRDLNGWPMRAKSILFHQIAVDGLATGTIWSHRYLNLFPGYRSDVKVQSPAQAGAYHLSTTLEPTQVQEAAGRKGTIKFLAKIVVRGAGPGHAAARRGPAGRMQAVSFDRSGRVTNQT